MGFLNDLKRIFFGAKAVSKGAVNKTVDYTKEKSEHLLDVTEDYLNDKKDSIDEKFTKIKTDVSDKGRDFLDNVKEKTEDVIDDIKESEIYKKTVETAEKAGDVILDTGEKFIEKSKEFIDGPGKEAAEKIKETSESIGETIIAGGKTIYNKATEATKNLGDKLDETIQKSEEFAKEQKRNKDNSEFADTPFDIKESELADKDDFFEKADKFASGEYSENPEPRVLDEKTETTKEDVDIEGFVDRDKDGNPLIDDATIIDENIDNKEEIT